MSNDSRYLAAYKTYSLDANFPFEETPGYCVWCGKLRPSKRKARFCLRNSDRPYDWCYFDFQAWWFSRPRFQRVILVRDDFTCQLCKIRPRFQTRPGRNLPNLKMLHVDHIQALVRGGKTELANLQTLCRRCNLKKGAK